MRLIDADKLELWLKRVGKFLKCEEDSKRVTKIIGKIIDHVNNAPTVEAKPVEWIPCNERLPRNDGEYLVWLRYEGREFTSIQDYKNKEGWDFCTYNPNDRVIAWMPLPPAYNAERGVKNE